MGFYQTRNRKFQKNSKKIQNIRKHNHSFFSSQNRLGKAEIERKKKSFRCAPTRLVIKNSKEITIKFKKSKNTIIASFQAKIGWEWPRKRKNKKNRSDGFLNDPKQKMSKRQQKNSKNQKTPSQLLSELEQVGKGRE